MLSTGIPEPILRHFSIDDGTLLMAVLALDGYSIAEDSAFSGMAGASPRASGFLPPPIGDALFRYCGLLGEILPEVLMPPGNVPLERFLAETVKLYLQAPAFAAAQSDVSPDEFPFVEFGDDIVEAVIHLQGAAFLLQELAFDSPLFKRLLESAEESRFLCLQWATRVYRRVGHAIELGQVITASEASLIAGALIRSMRYLAEAPRSAIDWDGFVASL